MRRATLAAFALVGCFPSLDHLDHLEHDALTDASVDVLPKPCVDPIDVKAAPIGVASVRTCDLDKMRVIDGEVGGIYRDDDSNSVEVIYDGLHHVTSCAAFDFGKTFDVDHVEVNAKASKSTCGHHCVEGAGCAMGNFYYVYVGPSLVLQDAKFVTQTTLNPPDSTIRTYPVSNNFPDVDKRYVFVCRSSAGADKDDIEIDGVRLCPR